jgi:hypoxanthine phosphoribosyltransferase
VEHKQGNSPGHLWVSWEEYHRAIEALAMKVHASGWEFDQILCLARGGLRPGDVFSRLFKLPLAILSTSSYREEAGTLRGELTISASLSSTTGPLAGKILLVDDLVDSGTTLKKVQSHIASHFPKVTELRSAVIWYKACSEMKPDYYLDYLADSPWIHQPFEHYDDITPDQLLSLPR